MNDNPLYGGVAVITGAARGLGEGIARAAAARGMKLVLADVSVPLLDALAHDLTRQGVDVIAVPTDVADPQALDALAATTFDHFGSVRLLVNNAGIETIGQAWELSAEQWERIIRINVLGPIHGVRAFGARMVAAQARAYIANVSSLGGLGMMPLQTPYIMTKHATLAFTEGLYLEMQRAAPMISVSAVLPGPVNTGIFSDATGTDAPDIGRLKAVMHDLLSSHGITPLQAGAMILDQIVTGDYWITTHPEMLAETSQSRAAFLSSLAPPVLNAQTRALLES
jgi:NAD(P)-dependent dehydrogenase (short-subunit alcohol dehydrogenase family)